MSNSSALIGKPPQTIEDYWIIKGMLRAVHKDSTDPEKGYLLFPKAPEGYQYEDKGADIMIGLYITGILMLFVTCVRLGLRLFRSGLRWGADDWLLIPGAFMAIAYPGLQIAMIRHGGGGKHAWDVTYAEYNIFNWLGVVCKIIFFTSVGIIKISIALFNRRLTGMTSRGWRYLNDFFLFLLAAYTLLSLFWTCFQCTPPAAMWDKVYSGKLAVSPVCWSTPVISNVLSTVHVVMDFCLLTTPVIVLWKVKLPTATKIRLYLVFSTGALSCIGSVLRQIEQHKISLDVTWGYTGILTWTLVDLSFGLLAASLPVIVGLLPSAWRPVTHKDASSRPTHSSAAAGHAYLSSSRSRATHTATDNSSSRSEEGGILVEEEFELTFYDVALEKSQAKASVST